MKTFSKKAYTIHTIIGKIVIFIYVCIAIALLAVLLSFLFPRKTEEQKQFGLLKEEFYANVTLPNKDWDYGYGTDLQNSETASVYVTADDFVSNEFYDMLCTIEDIREYLKTREDCKGKALKIGFKEWCAGRFWDFDMTFDTNGDIVFYYDWTDLADLSKLAEVFPDTNKVEFSYQFSDFGAIHIDELSDLSELESLKFTFNVDSNKAEEWETHIREVFPDCDLDIRN